MTTVAQARKDIPKDTNKGVLLDNLSKQLDSIAARTKEVVAGDGSATDIPVAGIKVGDILESVLHEDGTTGVTQAELVGEASITSDGNIQLSTTDTTADVLIVTWRPAVA